MIWTVQNDFGPIEGQDMSEQHYGIFRTISKQSDINICLFTAVNADKKLLYVSCKNAEQRAGRGANM